MNSGLKSIIFLFGVISFAHIKSFSQEYATDTNTVALWHFNEESGASVIDASTNHNDGTASGSVVTDGKYGKARSLPYITVPYSPSLYPETTITVDCWLRLNSIQNDGYSHAIFDSRYANDGKGYYMYVWPAADQIFFYYRGGSVAFSMSANGITTGVWYHLAGTYDGTSVKLYLNGIEKGSTDGVITQPYSNSALHIGWNDLFWAATLDGQIDEMRISNIARQPWEFGLPGRHGLVTYYPFNNNANDESGYGNHGTAMGEPAYTGSPNGLGIMFDNPLGNNPITQFVNLPDSMSIQQLGTSSFTISISYRTTDTSQENGRIFGNIDDSQRSGIGIDYNSKVQRQAYSGIRDVKGRFILIGDSSIYNDDPRAITTDGKYHLQTMVVDRDARQIHHYIDKNLIQTKNYDALDSIQLDGLVLGGGAIDGKCGSRNTTVDALYLYSRAFSNSEVDSLYREASLGTGTISGIVFDDINGNGIQDVGDTLLAGWKILLKNSYGTAVDSQIFNSKGNYFFAGFDAGTYTVSEVLKTGWIQTLPIGLGLYTVTISDSETVTGKDFGNTYAYNYTGPLTGNWSDSTNWTGGVPPTSDKFVSIPTGVVVTVDSLPADTVSAIRIEGSGRLQFSPKVSKLNVLRTLQIDDGASLEFPVESDTTGIVCYQDWVNRGTINPGHSIVTFSGNAPKTIASEGTENEFYKLEILGDSTSSIGNISVNDKLILTKPLVPRDQDTIMILSGDTSAIQDTGKIPIGTIKRAIDPYETGIYRFESPETYLKFSGGGTNPCAVSMTVLSYKPQGDLYWDSVGGRIDTVRNTIVVDSVKKFSKWPFGIPRPKVVNLRADSIYVKIDPINRAYIIEPECSDDFQVELSLRYDQSDIEDLMQKTGRTLSGTASESDLFLFRGPFAADSVHALWNMVSLPLIPDSANKEYLFPTSISSAFAYAGTYEERTDLRFGEGYWLKFPTAEEIIIEGADRDSMEIDISVGWNLIGAISYPIDAGSITTYPSGIIQTEFYEYKTAYQLADTLKPLKGYWVKVGSAGKLILKASDSGTLIYKENNTGSLKEMNSINVLDATKNQATLYFSKDKDINISRYELPPVPPHNMYDARYSTGKMVAIANENQENLTSIEITGAKYPVTISWEKKEELLESYLVIDDRMIEMGPTGEVIVNNDSTEILLKFGLKTDRTTPKEYKLHQNYPNPFNPVTTINYELPVQSWVTIKIYNVLGQEVKTLVDEVQSVGVKSVIWNSNNVASGVYFYRIEANSTIDPSKLFSQVKKMILLR